MKLYHGTQGKVNTLVATAPSVCAFVTQFFSQSRSPEVLVVQHNSKTVAMALLRDDDVVAVWDGYNVTELPVPQFQGA